MCSTFKTSVSLLIYFLDVSIDEVGVLKAPTFTVLSVSHIVSVNICFMCLGGQFDIHIYLQLLYFQLGLSP